MEETVNYLDVVFLMEEATLKKGFRRLKFSVGTTLQKTVRFYRITLYFNKEPYLSKIKANENVIAEIEGAENLFNNIKEEKEFRKGKTEKIEQDNKKILEEIDRLEELCPEFEFTGEAEKVEYNKETLTLKIDKETLDFLNRKEELFGYYKMILKPII
jgi:hypothetical protein